MKINKYFAGFVMLTAAMAGMACSFSLPGGAPAPTVGAGASPSPTAEATEIVRATKIPEAPPTQASGGLKSPAPTLAAGGQKALELPGVSANLGSLDSYRMSFALTVKGTDQNQKSASKTLTMLQEVIRSKNQSHIQMTGISLAGASDNGALDIYQVEKQSYLYSKSGENSTSPTCLSFSSGQQAASLNTLIQPDELIKKIEAKDLVAPGEAVNGVKADHYRLGNVNLNVGTVKITTGEIWIAQDGGYAVKFSGRGDGSIDVANETITGVTTLEYDLSSVNSLKAIDLPPECQTQQDAVGDLPVPPNASDIGNLGTLITLSSPDKPAVVASFYRAQLPSKGWMITKDSSLGADLVTLEISKGQRTMTIMITSDTNSKGSSVLITSK